MEKKSLESFSNAELSAMRKEVSSNMTVVRSQMGSYTAKRIPEIIQGKKLDRSKMQTGDRELLKEYFRLKSLLNEIAFELLNPFCDEDE